MNKDDLVIIVLGLAVIITVFFFQWKESKAEAAKKMALAAKDDFDGEDNLWLNGVPAATDGDAPMPSSLFDDLGINPRELPNLPHKK